MSFVFVLLFTFVLQFNEIKGERYDLSDGAGIASIILLVLASIVCIFAVIFFFYIVYKLWNGNFGRRRYYRRSTSYGKFVMPDQGDGRRESTNPVISYRNEVAIAEEAREVEKTFIETTVVEDGLKSEEVIVTQAPLTEEAEMETQELVIIFDDDDNIVDVLPPTT